jgi:hypothetical protein
MVVPQMHAYTANAVPLAVCADRKSFRSIALYGNRGLTCKCLSAHLFPLSSSSVFSLHLTRTAAIFIIWLMLQLLLYLLSFLVLFFGGFNSIQNLPLRTG